MWKFTNYTQGIYSIRRRIFAMRLLIHRESCNYYVLYVLKIENMRIIFERIGGERRRAEYRSEANVMLEIMNNTNIIDDR